MMSEVNQVSINLCLNNMAQWPIQDLEYLAIRLNLQTFVLIVCHNGQCLNKYIKIGDKHMFIQVYLTILCWTQSSRNLYF